MIVSPVVKQGRPGSSSRRPPDCVQVVSIGAVPAIVLILHVGAMPADGRQKAKEQKGESALSPKLGRSGIPPDRFHVFGQEEGMTETANEYFGDKIWVPLGSNILSPKYPALGAEGGPSPPP